MAAGTEYIGVMLYGETELTFDLLSVSAVSREYTADTMEAMLFPVSGTNTENPYATEIFYLLVLLAAVSVCVSVILFRREREDE